MFVVFLLLWIVAVMLIYANPKTPWAWWASSCLFLNGFGGIAVIFTDDIIPLAEKTGNGELMVWCLVGKGIANALQHYLSTYALIGFILYFTNFLDFNLKNSTKLAIMLLLSVPSILMFILYPIDPGFDPDYKVLSAWVVIYTLSADAILVISILKQRDLGKKYNMILAAIFSIPSTLSIMWTSYLSVAMGFDELWYLNFWIIIFQFLVFVILAFKHGVLGIRIKVERYNMDDTIDTLINGMSIISHSIKNEASIISLCIDTIRCLDDVSPDTDKKLSIIKESSKNLNDLTYRINKFNTFQMTLEPYMLNILIEKIVDQILPMASGKNINIINRCKEDITIMVDAVHIQEVFKNILINSIEAIPDKGTIIIDTGFIDNKLYVSIEDNGIGIPASSIEKVLTPFYSTKKGRNNFGLGLSYCYKVMKYHSGNLKIASKLNRGTKMSLLFPMDRVIKPSIKISAEK